MELLTKLAYNTAGSLVVNAVLENTPVVDKLASSTSSSLVNYLKSGAVLEVVERGVQWVENGQMDNNFMNFIDDSVFNAGSLALLKETNLINMTNEALVNVPVGDNVKQAAVMGAVVTATQTVRDMLKTWDVYKTTPLKYVVSITSLLPNQNY